jgi:hypothetical protein
MSSWLSARSALMRAALSAARVRCRQQKLISKVRDGAKVSNKHDTAATAFHRAIDHRTMTEERIAALAIAHGRINPAAMSAGFKP